MYLIIKCLILIEKIYQCIIKKHKNEHREGKKKRNNINSIESRPFSPDDRSEFGHWEGDTIVGSRNIKNSGAVFTLVERKTRFQLTIKMHDRKSNTVSKAFKLLKRGIQN